MSPLDFGHCAVKVAHNDLTKVKKYVSVLRQSTFYSII